MSLQRIVVVGAGQAGFDVAANLRKLGYDNHLHLIGQENTLPYKRPPLSKTFLKQAEADRLLLRKADFYERQNIQLKLGVTVKSIDRARHLVFIDNGDPISYDHLILATGVENRHLELPGINAKGVFQLRSLQHAKAIHTQIQHCQQLLVIGGGFIGLEVAAVAREMGKSVCIVEASERLMGRAVSPAVSEHCHAAHTAAGIDIQLQQQISAITHDSTNAVNGVEFGDGKQLAADMILVCVGVTPNTSLAEDAGLAVDNGIVVDEYLQTSDKNISAIGDCASFPHRISAGSLRLESIQNATDHAKCVAQRLLGKPQPYDELAWFWSDQGNLKLQMAGLPQSSYRHPDDQQSTRWHSVQQTGPDSRLTVYSFRNDQFIGLEAVNAAADFMAARKILSSGNQYAIQDFENAEYSMRSLLASS